MQGKKMKIKELKPGMILMDNIYCPHTGILLLKTGTVLRRAFLSALQKNNPDLYCYACRFPGERASEEILDVKPGNYAADDLVLEEVSGLEEIPGEENCENKRLFPPEFVDREAEEIYSQACRVFSKIYSSRKIKPHFRELYSVIENLVDKLLIHPEMMIYAALLKKIDNSTFSHAVNVCVFSAFLGRVIGVKEPLLRELALAGIMHDIGKMDIPAEIWHKKGPLTVLEFNKVKEHSLYSYFRLANIDQVNIQTLAGVLQHHERLDGSGYPHGLKNDELHLWSRILGITDVFDAYTSERIFRKAYSFHQGFEHLRQNSTRFDNRLLNIFIKNLSFFPIGSRVLLNTGEKGIVMGIHKYYPNRPIIRVEKKDGSGEKLMDLAESRSVFIEKLL